MTITLDSVITRLAERVSDRTTSERQCQNQRRNQVVDLDGLEYQRQGDANHPATFYISISNDLIYYERFEFKIIIQPFAMPVGSGATGNAVVNVDSTSLATSGGAVSPNPHKHTTQEHNHSLDSGITLFSSSVSNFELWIEDVDMTPYLMAQYDGAWINGEGVFPDAGLSRYDILEAAGYMPAWQQGIILQPGYKKIEIKNNGVFNAILVNYLKYSHVNR